MAARIKARNRTYLESNLHFFEIKVKTNFRTQKYREQLSSEQDQLSKKQRKKINSFYNKVRPFYHKKIHELLAPTLLTSYTRITLVNKEKTERCTIDLNLTFRNPHDATQEIEAGNIAIIEQKQRKPSVTVGMGAALRQMRNYPSSISK